MGIEYGLRYNMPLTNKEKSAARREELNKIANELGFQSWRKFETEVKRQYAARDLKIKIVAAFVCGITWKPPR